MDELTKKIKKYSDLLKQAEFCIDFDAFEKPLHKNVCDDFAAMKQSAKDAGFELALASGYRSVARQIVIWNEKAQGKRTVLDSEENPIDTNKITKKELLFAILRWSALPGVSRHHWGSDFDVYDASAIDSNYQLQLTIKETQKDGPFYPFYGWLEEYLKQPECKFYRPYATDFGGVAPEPWHLSHKHTAQAFSQALTVEAFSDCIDELDILLKKEVKEEFPLIYQRFVSPE